MWGLWQRYSVCNGSRYYVMTNQGKLFFLNHILLKFWWFISIICWPYFPGVLHILISTSNFKLNWYGGSVQILFGVIICILRIIQDLHKSVLYQMRESNWLSLLNVCIWQPVCINIMDSGIIFSGSWYIFWDLITTSSARSARI